MKKLVYLFAIMLGLSFVSCCDKADSTIPAENDTTVTDTVDNKDTVEVTENTDNATEDAKAGEAKVEEAKEEVK